MNKARMNDLNTSSSLHDRIRPLPMTSQTTYMTCGEHRQAESTFTTLHLSHMALYTWETVSWVGLGIKNYLGRFRKILYVPELMVGSHSRSFWPVYLRCTPPENRRISLGQTSAGARVWSRLSRNGRGL